MAIMICIPIIPASTQTWRMFGSQDPGYHPPHPGDAPVLQHRLPLLVVGTRAAWATGVSRWDERAECFLLERAGWFVERVG